MTAAAAEIRKLTDYVEDATPRRGIASSRARDEVRAYFSLAELMERPELLKPPPPVLPKITHAGRATLLAAGDKAGKSTMAAAGGASLTRRGHFLGERVGGESGRVIWAGLEEAVGDAVLRFQQMGAIADNIQIVVVAGPSLLKQTRELLNDWPADLLLVDSITEYARVVHGSVPEDGDSSGWADVVRPLVSLTREFPSLSALLLHHARRDDGQFRGSGEIAAAVDCLLEMRPPARDEDPTIRHITGRARWPVAPFDVRYVDGSYQMAGAGELSLDARILIHVEQNPGVSISKLRTLVGGRGATIDTAVSNLLMREALVDLGTGGQHKYYCPGSQTSMAGLTE